MRVGFDIRYLTHGLTGGVKTYVWHLAHWMPRVAPDVEFVYYGDTKAALDLPAASGNVRIRILPYRSPLSTLTLDRALARHMAGDAVDLAHYPANYGPRGRYRLVVTVHDTYNLFPLREHLRAFGKDPWRVSMMLYLGRQTRKSLREADLVVTVSEHARRDLAARSGRSANGIVAIHEAAGESFALLDAAQVAAVRTRFDLPSVVLLADGVKNPATAVEAWRRVRADLRDAAALVFFSREPLPRPEIAAAIDGWRIRFLPRPSAEDLAGLMNLAAAFVFPSFHEGFGLPLVEAMRCGAPVIASTRGAIPEVVGNAALTFAVGDPQALARHMEAVLTDPELRARMRTASLRRSQAFDWERAARQTVAVYRGLLESAPDRTSQRREGLTSGGFPASSRDAP
jgi:glycosyltransferase involved in cell wall biosynthesis